MTDLPPRDLRGHAGRPPDPRWPGGARLALSLVVNVEEGAELAISRGDARNEAAYEAREEVEGAPDPCMESHFAYGARAGLWRILDALDAHGAKATFSACGRAVAANPHLAAEPARRGHEVSAHGWRWERHAGMAEDTERRAIADTVRAIADATGERPVGWHTRSAASVNTRRLLREAGGFLYDSDEYDDDVPRLHAPDHVILPYAFDTNDMRFAPGGGFVQHEDFSRYCIGAMDWLVREARGGAAGGTARMMSIGLHLRIIGRPARMAGLVAVLEHARRTPGIWIARRRDIARHWIDQGLP